MPRYEILDIRTNEKFAAALYNKSCEDALRDYAAFRGFATFQDYADANPHEIAFMGIARADSDVKTKYIFSVSFFDWRKN
jgi:hypothetical protein